MRLLIVSTMKNEGPFVLDWIAHHRAMGATDFLIYSNDCTDGTDVLLDALDRAGVVTHVPQLLAGDEKPQWAALKKAWKHDLRKACDWAAVLDVDEYICVHQGDGTFADIWNVCDAQAVTLPWRLFGNAGVVGFKDQPVPDQFQRCARTKMQFPVSAQFFKSLFRLDGPFSGFGVHRPKHKSGAAPVWADGSGGELAASHAGNPKQLNLTGLPPARDLVECFHYSLRSMHSYLVKSARGLPNHVTRPVDLSYWVRRNFNQIENTAILRRADATAAARQKLMELSGVAGAHKSCVDAHRKEIAALLAVPGMLELYSDLLVAGPSSEIGLDVVQHLSGLFRAATKES